MIIPVYNIQNYIERCLDSVVKQALLDIEIIVVNDGSTDGGLQIIEQFAQTDERIVVINKPNSGLASARNAGLSFARGEYIAHVDGDDWLEQGYLQAVYKAASEKALDVVVTDYWKDYDNGIKKQIVDLPIADDETIDGRRWLEYFFARKATQSSFNKIYKRNLYKENNISIPRDISIGEDLSTIPRVIYQAGRIGKINKPYYHYVQRPSSLTNNINENSTDAALQSLMAAFVVLQKFFAGRQNILARLEKHRISQIAIFIFTPQVAQDSVLIKELSAQYLYVNSKQYIVYSTKRIAFYSLVLRYIPNVFLLSIVQKLNSFAQKMYVKVRII